MRTDIARSTMFRSLIACASLFLLAGLSNGVQAAPEESSQVDAAETPVSQSPIQLLRLEIEGILEAGRVRVATLEAELESTEGFEAVIDLHRAIERAKVQTEIELFQAQLVFAENTGRTKMAETLRTTLTDLAARHEIELENAAAEPAER